MFSVDGIVLIRLPWELKINLCGRESHLKDQTSKSFNKTPHLIQLKWVDLKRPHIRILDLSKEVVAIMYLDHKSNIYPKGPRKISRRNLELSNLKRHLQIFFRGGPSIK